MPRLIKRARSVSLMQARAGRGQSERLGENNTRNLLPVPEFVYSAKQGNVISCRALRDPGDKRDCWVFPCAFMPRCARFFSVDGRTLFRLFGDNMLFSRCFDNLRS